MTTYLELGADPAKLVLGIPLYGRTFKLTDVDRHEVGDPAADKAFKGPYTREDGFLGYNEICEMRAAAPIQWTTRWDDEAKVPYVFHEKMWVSLDDEQSITNKVRDERERGRREEGEEHCIAWLSLVYEFWWTGREDIHRKFAYRIRPQRNSHFGALHL